MGCTSYIMHTKVMACLCKHPPLYSGLWIPSTHGCLLEGKSEVTHTQYLRYLLLSPTRLFHQSWTDFRLHPSSQEIRPSQQKRPFLEPLPQLFALSPADDSEPRRNTAPSPPDRPWLPVFPARRRGSFLAHLCKSPAYYEQRVTSIYAYAQTLQ